MAKPDVTLTRWADGGGATVTPPLSGHRDSGFVAGDPVDEGIYNALMLEYYEWFSWISDTFDDNGHLQASREVPCDILAGQQSAGTAAYDGTVVAFGSSSAYDVPISGVSVGERITALYVDLARAGGTIALTLYERGPGTITSKCAKNYSTATGNQTIEIGTSPDTGSLPVTVATGKTYFVRMQGNGSDELHAVRAVVAPPV